MTDRLQEIRNRFDAIIPGPWRWYGNTATDQVMLATTDRGRLFILTASVRTTEYVLDHEIDESYTLERARDLVIEWCGAHGEGSDPALREVNCNCDELREFLRGELHPEEGHREFGRFSRGVQVHPDLHFPVTPPASRQERDGELRKRVGGYMRSYRDLARYEVLGYRTVVEWEMDQGGVVPSADRDIRNFLYREDFCGLDQPEATFIERAPEDTEYLLKRVAYAERALASMQLYASWAMRGQQLQGTADAQARAARDLLALEELER